MWGRSIYVIHASSGALIQAVSPSKKNKEAEDIFHEDSRTQLPDIYNNNNLTTILRFFLKNILHHIQNRIMIFKGEI